MKTASKVAAILLIIICVGLTGVAQDKLRQVDQPGKFVYKDNPVEVVSLSVGEKPVTNGQVNAESNWLHNFNLKIKNVSGKDIGWIETNLILREEGPGRSRIVLPVYFGETKPDRIPRILLAGETTTLQPRKDDVDFWIRYCKSQGIEDIDRVILDIRKVRFTDDTGWYLGIPTTKDSETNNYRPSKGDQPASNLPIFEPNTNLIISEPTPVFFSA